MLNVTNIPPFVLVALVAIQIGLCWYLERRHRKNIRFRRIEKRLFSPAQLELFQKMRERMLAKEQVAREKERAR